MSLTRIKSFLVGLSLALSASNAALAQSFVSQHMSGPAPEEQPVFHAKPGSYSPFIDPGYFRSDFQFFAPAEYEEYGGEFKAKTGWFASWDRLYVWVTRPRQEASYPMMDNTWGNRFDWGYMTEEQNGWLFSMTHIDGPAEIDYLRVELLNRWSDPNGQPSAGQGGGGANQNTTGGTFPSNNRNDSESNERSYDVRNSINAGKLSNIEMNKLFRLDPGHNGTFIETFAGLRYTRFVDYTMRDTYARFDATGVPVGNFPPPDLTTAVIEQITQVDSNIINDMFGGQLGFRMYRNVSRWKLDSTVRAFAMQNFQAFTRVTNVSTAQYDGIDVDTDPLLYVFDRTRVYDHAAEFVLGCELRGNASYEVTRDLSLNFGATFLEFGRGIARGPDLQLNAQSMQIFGLAFGINYNY